MLAIQQTESYSTHHYPTLLAKKRKKIGTTHPTITKYLKHFPLSTERLVNQQAIIPLSNCDFYQEEIDLNIEYD